MEINGRKVWGYYLMPEDLKSKKFFGAIIFMVVAAAVGVMFHPASTTVVVIKYIAMAVLLMQSTLWLGKHVVRLIFVTLFFVVLGMIIAIMLG
jgi:hypothetical protein